MNLPVEHHGRKAKQVLAMQLLCDARECRREVGLIVQLKVPAARFFGQPLESGVRLAAHLARSVEIIAAEADRVNHHFFAPRLLEHAAAVGAAAGIVTVCKYEHDAAAI